MIAEGTIEAFRLQAHFCAELEAPLYAELMTRAADDIEAGGPVAAVLDGWVGRPMPDALPLRLAGAVHRMVLAGEAPELARFYPSAGGAPRWPETWDAIRALLASRADEIRPALARQVQTNEIRRSAALLGGFLAIARATGLPLRLLEIGCSAGLNQFWDRYRYELAECDEHRPPAADAEWCAVWGDPAAEVVVRCGWHGSRAVLTDASPLAARALVRERAGCDIAPIDVRDPAQALTLESFIWPEHLQRLAQLRSAIAAARRDPPRLTRSGAGDWLAAQLGRSTPGTATTVFHSIMWWYLSEEERARVTALVEAAGARATEAAPLAWLRLEILGAPHADLRLTRWPGGEERLLAHADAQGRWVAWRG